MIPNLSGLVGGIGAAQPNGTVPAKVKPPKERTDIGRVKKNHLGGEKGEATGGCDVCPLDVYLTQKKKKKRGMNEALKSISFQSINGGNWPRTVQWELNMWDQSQTHTH